MGSGGNELDVVAERKSEVVGAIQRANALRAALGNRTPDLRITSRKRGVRRVMALRGQVRGRVQGSVIAQCVGCSVGCSQLATARLSRLLTFALR